MSVPDYALETTFHFKFTTRAFATGVPTTFAGTPVLEIYEDDDLTQITGAETLIVDFDGTAGFNNLKIVATAANGFETQKSYAVKVAAGTVGGTSIVGETLLNFTIDRIPKAVWDRILTGATHPIIQSAGKRLRAVAGTILFEGTATAGAVNSITMPAGASALDNFYRDMRIIIVGGTGVEQSRIVISYDGTTKIAIVVRAWLTAPDNTSEFEVVSGNAHAVGTNLDLETGYAAAGGASTITLNGDASTIDNFYDEAIVSIHSGTGEGQFRNSEGYVGSTKVMTVQRAWDTVPDATSEYVITATITANHIADHVADEPLAGHTTPGTLGKAITDTESDVTAVKGKTDDLTFSKANELDANIHSVDDDTVTGDGQAGTEWGPV